MPKDDFEQGTQQQHQQHQKLGNAGSPWHSAGQTVGYVASQTPRDGALEHADVAYWSWERFFP